MKPSSVRALALVAACALFPAAQVFSQSTLDEIAKYRQALQEGNPAELWEARGEALWKEKRGPKNASLEACDLGKGAGVVKGAYAQMPRYFTDADRVMDLETRLAHCMVSVQGMKPEDADATRDFWKNSACDSRLDSNSRSSCFRLPSSS